jgi:hypothetical protein
VGASGVELGIREPGGSTDHREGVEIEVGRYNYIERVVEFWPLDPNVLSDDPNVDAWVEFPDLRRNGFRPLFGVSTARAIVYDISLRSFPHRPPR